jgi:hypothetical protein
MEPNDAEIEAFYTRLLAVLRQAEVLRDGAWSQIDPLPAWEGNRTHAPSARNRQPPCPARPSRVVGRSSSWMLSKANRNSYLSKTMYRWGWLAFVALTPAATAWIEENVQPDHDGWWPSPRGKRPAYRTDRQRHDRERLDNRG